MKKPDPIAVVGMSCLFPGSPRLDVFWQNMLNGSTYTSAVPADRWNHAEFYNPDRRNTECTYARKIACLDDLRSFGPEQYGMPPRRAYPMDPQQRLFLDQTRIALDDAGYRGRPLPKTTGVYVGASGAEYKDLVVSRFRARQLLGGEWGQVPHLPKGAAECAVKGVAATQKYTLIGLLTNMIACNVSGVYDLRGPSMVMDAACSSALLALQEAVIHLRGGICDAAVVGGIYTICTPDLLIGFSRIGALSGTDTCRPFDEKADGFVLGEGVGVVVLKRLEDAIRDRDHIWAVIRGVGLNNDGRGEGPMTPRLSGQADALARAYRDADLSPDTVGYVEAHGTATPVGDLTEIAALKENIKELGRGPVRCAVASVKGNIGHSLSASGIAGFIRAVLALDRRVIPPQAGLQNVRAKLNLNGSGFYIPTSPQPFESVGGLPRRAGVSAFGFGGTNVHVVLEEPGILPGKKSLVSVSGSVDPQLFVISAATPAHLTSYLADLSAAISTTSAPIRDLAYTLTVGRRREHTSVAFLACSRGELLEKLKLAAAAVQEGRSNGVLYSAEPLPESDRKIAFLFPAQGKLWSHFRSHLNARFPGFRARLEGIVAKANGTHKFPSLAPSERTRNGNGRPANGNGNGHGYDGKPELAAAQLALVESLAELGLKPQAAIGRGFGEVVAAAVGGILKENAALQLASQLGARARSGATNGENRAFLESVAGLHISAPRIPVFSSVTGAPYSDDREHFATILVRACTEDFSHVDTTAPLQSAGANICVGFGTSLENGNTPKTSAAADSNGSPRIFNFFEPERDITESLLGALGELAVLGIPLNFSSLFGDSRIVTLPSPIYPSRPYWVISKKSPDGVDAAASAIEDVLEEDEIIDPASEALPAEVSAEAPALPMSEQEVHQKVIETIMQLTAFPPESLKPEIRFADLGFDSLMWMDLYDALMTAIPQAKNLPESLIRMDTTVGDLLREVVTVVFQAADGGQETPAQSEIQRYAVVPMDAPLSDETPDQFPFAGPVVILSDARGVAPILAANLAQAGISVRTVWPGEEFQRETADALVDLSGLDPIEGADDATAMRESILAALRRAAAMASGGSAPAAFLAAHVGLRSAGIAGAAKALAREWPSCLVRSVELDVSAAPQVIAGRLLAELRSADRAVEVSYASGTRQVPTLELHPAQSSSLVEGAVVVISGGGRGLGAKLAVELARRHKARVLLLGRSPDTENTVQSVIRAGGMALYAECDVRDMVQVAAAFDECRQAFGPIQHVVHTAGVLSDEPIATKDIARAAAVLDTKVAGALALWEAAKADPLRSFLMYGSWAGRFGNAGQTDYSAANHLLGKLASELGSERSDVRVVTLDLPPWEGSGMVSQLPEAVRNTLRSRVQFLNDETGLALVLAELGATGPSGEVTVGGGLEGEFTAAVSMVSFSRAEQPWLDDHRFEGRILLPLAVSLDYAAALATRMGLGPDLSLSEIVVSEPLRIPETGAAEIEIAARRNRTFAEIGITSSDRGKRQPAVRLNATTASDPLPLSQIPAGGTAPEISIPDFYESLNFHGERFRVLSCVQETGPGHIAGQIRVPELQDSLAGNVLSILALDGMLQLCAYWAWANFGVAGLPVGADEIRVFGRPPAGVDLHVTALLRTSQDGILSGDLDLTDAEKHPLLQVRGLRCKMVNRQNRAAIAKTETPAPQKKVDPENCRIEDFPEVKALENLVVAARSIGIESPYFSVHERVTNETSLIGGREYVNFASYNYLGLSGDSDVTAAAIEAMNRYGTSVSASRLVSGEKPLHRELEREIADFLGCEDSVAMVSGHATNVSVIGHLFGPKDLVVHDSLAHDSILEGIQLSGAKRLAFAHNDPDSLDQLLQQARQTARRVLIAVEAVYSMDGDIAPLARIVEIKRRHNALLLVDEAHSLGVLGPTGRGIGEYANIARKDVELWMGTLSKSLASCGGYIAGTKEVIYYLKHANPGFVYSVGMSPANTGAALAALRKLRASPELVATLQERSRRFLELCRSRGVNTGSSEGTPIVPCLVGSSVQSVRLSRALASRGLNVQPILHPAVEEHLARLRFFVTARHTEEQLLFAADVLAEEMLNLGLKPVESRSFPDSSQEVSAGTGV